MNKKTDYDSINIKVENVFIDFMRSFFTSNARYPWLEDHVHTKIFIEECHPVDTSRVKDHPALLVEVGNVAFRNGHIDQLADWQWVSKKRPEIMVKKFADFIIMNLAFHCVSREGLEARDLAFKVMTALTANRPYLRSSGIVDVAVPQMMPDNPLSEDLFLSTVITSCWAMAEWDWQPKQGPLWNKTKVDTPSGSGIL